MTASPETRAGARDWIAAQATPTVEQFTTVLEELYGDGALIGTATALQQTGGTVAGALADLLPDVQSGKPDWQQFWDSWTPGHPDAAGLLNDGGLADLLDNADVTIRGVIGSTLDRLGNVLADGAASGESVDAIAASLSDIVNDPMRSFMIANTELNRAVSTAALDSYGANGIGQWDLIVSPDACDDCDSIAAANPHDVEDGEDQPPLHPSCRCAVAPVTTSAGSGDGSTSEVAD